MNETYDAPRGLRWRTMVSGALLALGLQCPAIVQARCQLKVLELPIKMVDSRAITTVRINGTPVQLMVDSGAFYSFLTEATAAQFKLRERPLPDGLRIQGVLGSVDARLTHVAHLGLDNGDLANQDFIVGGNQLGAGSMGILGRNILSLADTEFDLAHGMIRIVLPNDDCDKSNMAYWADDTPVSMVELQTDSRERLYPSIRADLMLNGHKVTAMFDSGASTTVSLDTAHKAGVKDADMQAQGRMYGAGRGKASSWTASFDRVELGGESVTHNRLRIGDFDLENADMLLGVDFFLSHHIYVSRKQSRIYFTYNGGPVFALNVNDPASVAASGTDAGPGEALTADDYARRGAASLSRGDTASALGDLDQACALAPANGSFFAIRASVHLARKERNLGLADLDTALRLDPDLADARMRRVSLHASKADRDLALAVADLALLDRTLPPQSQIRRSMAQVYNSLGMPAQVLMQWNQWIAANPRDIGLEEAYSGRCWARVELGIELDKALDDCDEAVDADNKNASYLDGRGWVYLRLDKLQKALDNFDRSIAIRPNGAWSLYGRGLVHLRLGQAALGQADLAEARQAQPDVDNAIKRIGLPSAPDATP